MVEHNPLRDLHLSSTLFVGDSLATDMQTSLENDIDCALVFSGTTTRDGLNRSPLTPTYVTTFKHTRMVYSHLSLLSLFVVPIFPSTLCVNFDRSENVSGHSPESDYLCFH